MRTSLDAIILTDATNDEDNMIVDSIKHQLLHPCISWEKSELRQFSGEELKHLDETSMTYFDRSDFDEKFDKVKDSLDKNELLIYSKKTNPKLYSRLLSDEKLSDVLWNTYLESISDSGWSHAANYNLLKGIAEKARYPNIVEVLFNHKIIPLELGVPGNIPYHMIGRGFVAEGGKWSLMDKDNKLLATSIIALPLVLFGGQKEKLACSYELINHEIIGHKILGLKDHSISEVKPTECIMSIPDERQVFIELAQQYRGLKFCRDCEIKYVKHNFSIM